MLLAIKILLVRGLKKIETAWLPKPRQGLLKLEDARAHARLEPLMKGLKADLESPLTMLYKVILNHLYEVQEQYALQSNTIHDIY